MAETTNIEWAESTLNFWEGCQETGSPACVACYARERNLRYAPKGTTQAPNWGPHAPRRPIKSWPATLRKISRDAKAAFAAGRTEPWFVFVNSLSDFWDNKADPAWRRAAFEAFATHPHLTFLLLTKRSGNILPMTLDMVKADLGPYADEQGIRSWWPKNVAIGCTAVTQVEVDRDASELIRAAGVLHPAFTFLSIEPQAEDLDLMWPDSIWPGGPPMCCSGRDCGCMGMPTTPPLLNYIDWVIAGGMTDQGRFKATPVHPLWFESVRSQCAQTRTAFLFKQWGSWRGGEIVEDERYEGGRRLEFSRGNSVAISTHPFTAADFHDFGDGYGAWRCGKKHAGRELNGLTHDERPKVAA